MPHIIRHYTRLALFWQTAAGLLLGAYLILIIWLFPQNTFKIPFLWLIVLAGIYAVLLLNVGGQYSKTSRVLGQLAQGTLPTSPAPTLPNPALALPAGGSVTLSYQRQSSSLVKVVLNYSIRLLISTICFEAALLYFTPDAVPTFLGSIIGVPLVVQWLLLALPPALWVFFSLYTLRTTLRTSSQSLTIDDRGITRRRPWGQDEHIGWQDIKSCVRMLFFTGDQVLGSYMIYGPERYLEIPLYPLGVLSGRSRADNYLFTPDPANYRAVAEQVLATILARSGVSLQVISTAYYSKGGRYSSYTIGVAAQDVAGAPEAPLAYQPPPYALDWARSYPGAYSLPVTQNFLMSQPTTNSASLLKSRLARGLLNVVLGIIIFFLLLPDLGPAVALLIALIALLPGFFLLARAVRQASTRSVEIVADPAGLSRTGAGPKLFIPWNQVQAWGVIPPTGRQQDAVYAVLWSGTTLTWAEPQQATLPVAQGNGRAAYLDAAHALHALIVVRTGQPMRFLNQ